MIKKIGVVGAGMMGAEIALYFAMEGYEVILSDISLEVAKKGKENQEQILDRRIKRGRLEEQRKEPILELVSVTDDNLDLADCDLVIEAVVEVLEIKNSVLKSLDEACKEQTIIASNTSSISITKLASAVSEERAKKFVGMHFNSPASVMKLVEVIPGLVTEKQTTETIINFLAESGKEPVEVKDVVGFALNRIFHVFYLEACRLVEEGVCTPEDVDIICEHGLGHPMGIFRLLDITGHDLNLQVDEILFEAYGERFRPSPQIQRLVDSGRLGRRTGQGFYKYDKK